MVFPLILAAVTGAVEVPYSATTMKLIDAKLFDYNKTVLTPLKVEGTVTGAPAEGVLLSAEKVATAGVDSKVKCPKNWYTNATKAKGVTTQYSTAVAAGTPLTVGLQKRNGAWFGVNCYEECKDTPDTNPPTVTKLDRCFEKTYALGSSWSNTTCETYKGYCYPDLAYADSDTTDEGKTRYCCPAKCNLCTLVEIGTAIDPTACTADIDVKTKCKADGKKKCVDGHCAECAAAADCAGKGEKTKCVEGTCAAACTADSECTKDGKTKCVDGHCAAPPAACTVNTESTDCTKDGKTKCVDGHCAAPNTGSAMSYGMTVAALLIALAF